jgi:glutaryl-CoA dehydrogenase (non-decarboxylating)
VDFTLSEEHLGAQDLARDFARREILPRAQEWERTGRFPRDVVRAMGELGFFGCVIPEEWGGTGAGYLAHVLLVEGISRAHFCLATAFNVQGASVPRAIVDWGTPEQKARYVRALVRGEIIGCHAITEPNAGSDLAGIQATARRDGDAYVLNGTKMWITYAPVADLALVFAKTNPAERHRGISAFLVETDTPNLTIHRMDAVTGSNCLPTGEMAFQDCRVPADALLGPENGGFRVAVKMLQSTRVTIPARAVGNAQACLDAAVPYAQQRHAFGVPIGTFQMIKKDIAEMTAHVAAARLLVYQLAWLMDMGKPCAREASIAKLFASEVGLTVALRAQFIHGAYGFSKEYPIAGRLVEAQFLRIAEGTSNIHRLIIADDALGYKKADRE